MQEIQTASEEIDGYSDTEKTEDADELRRYRNTEDIENT